MKAWFQTHPMHYFFGLRPMPDRFGVHASACRATHRLKPGRETDCFAPGGGKGTYWPHYSLLAAALILLTGTIGIASQNPATPALYTKQAACQETMLATRARYATWLAGQPIARGAVTCDPWFESRLASAGKEVDLAAKQKDGSPLWTQRSGWKDGAILVLSADAGQSSSTCLFRKVMAVRPVTLTVGLGGGDELEVWLNGARLLSQDTALVYDRYGTSMRAEGTRRDQVLVNLPLVTGENRLLIALRQGAASRNQPLNFYFSTAPDPVPMLWEKTRKDFPAPANHLLAVAKHDWFETKGWFQSLDTRLERRLVESCIKGTDDDASDGDASKPSGVKSLPTAVNHVVANPAAASLRARLNALTQAGVGPQDRRWLDLCVTAAETLVIARDIARLRAAVEELGRSFPRDYTSREFLARLDDLEKRLARQAVDRLDPADQAAARLIAELEQHKHEMLVRANPLLKGATLLFAKRYTYNSQHYYDDYYHGPSAWGGNLCSLSLDDGKLTEIAPQLAGGIFDRYDLSFDGRRIVFGYRAPKPDGFRIYEIGVDGRGLRQLTSPPAEETERVTRYSTYARDEIEKNPLLYGHWTDDMHPCYLPDGGIAFTSSRCERSVLCGGHPLTVATLHRMDGDGGNLRRLSQGALTEFTPTVLEDGRILYNRWEYVYKGIAAVQPLWAMRPDGSGSEEIYGDNIANPGVFVQGRQVPGRPDLMVCSGVGHEPLSVGTILLLDLHRDKRTPAVMASLTPDTDVKGLRGLYQRRNGQWREDVYGPFACDPYPLADPATGAGAGKFFLVSHNPDKRYNDKSAYGIYLLDVFGNRVLVHRDPQMSCFEPMLLHPRQTPPVLAPLPVPSLVDAKEASEATVVVADVYQGLDGVKRGAVKYLRVLEQIPRPWSVYPHSADDGIAGQMVAISLFTHIWVAILEGVVPVQEDGSACFKVPAGKNLYFQALDENFMQVQGMRTFVNFQPGESRSCVGCHEHRGQAPVSRDLAALRHPPARLQPQPGDRGPRPLHYPADVQPVLDKHCAQCHSGAKPDGNLNLSGELTEHFCRSYEELVRGGYVNFIQEWTGPRLPNPPDCFTVGGSMAHAPAVPAYTYGSPKSKLMAALLKEHYDVRLPREDFIKLATWVDANAPFYGSYFGHRNIRYKGRPDFRATPTLASASGIRPEPIRNTPVAARLAAWWRLDDGPGAKAADASGAGHDGKVVKASRTDGKTGGALQFAGDSYVEAGGLGAFETLSVALWVKAGALQNRWNPLLFCNGWEQSAFHFSLLTDGRVNVALNLGENQALHRASSRAVGDGRWHHIAVVCDARPGGVIRFYVDGKKDSETDLDIGLPLLLDGFRVGAWNRWEKSPANNFHGALDDIRLYHGTLGDDEIARLAAGDGAMTMR